MLRRALPKARREAHRDWYFIAEQPAPAPNLAHPEGCAALRIVLVTVPRVSRSCEFFPDELDLHLPHQHLQLPQSHFFPKLSGEFSLVAQHLRESTLSEFQHDLKITT